MNTDSIRQAVHAAIKDNPAGLKGEAVAARMGVATSSLYRWGEPDEANIPLERLVQLVLITGDIRPAQAFASAVGGLFLPQHVNITNGDRASVKAVKEFADFLQANAQALLDGKVSAKENARIQREGAEAMKAIAELMEHARASAEARRV